MRSLKDLLEGYDIIGYCLRLLILCQIIFTVHILADIDREADDGGFSAQFTVVNPGRLYGDLLMYWENYEHSDCTDMCIRHLRCVSVNYNAKQKICEVMGDEYDEIEAVKEPNWYNYGTPDKVDGGYSSWGHGPCSTTCGSGVRVIYRTCTHPVPKHGGQQCEGMDRKTGACHERHCPVDGGWSSWSTRSPCSTSCGFGMREKKRACTQPVPQHDGRQCHGNETETEECLVIYCPVSNVAFNKSTSASNIWVKYITEYPSRAAVDGDTSFTTYFCEYTENAHRKWWRVDFGEEILIRYTVVHLKPGYISGAAMHSKTWFGEKESHCFDIIKVFKQTKYNFTCDQPSSDLCTKLEFYHSHKNYLQLYEVQVFGFYIKDRINVAKGKTAEQSSTEGSFVAGNAIDEIRKTHSKTLNSSPTPPWWHVDLGVLTMLYKIRFVLNEETDYAKYTDLVIYSRKSIDEEWSVYENKIIDGKLFTLMTYLQQRDARFINVTSKRNVVLSIKEIRVIGFPLNPSYKNSVT